MKTLHFSIAILAPATTVYDRMLGLSSLSSYEQWTALFNPTSTYEGNWIQGEKILFVGVDENGVKGGMVSRILANTPNQFVSIQHYGLIQNRQQIAASPGC